MNDDTNQYRCLETLATKRDVIPRPDDVEIRKAIGGCSGGCMGPACMRESKTNISDIYTAHMGQKIELVICYISLKLLHIDSWEIWLQYQLQLQAISYDNSIDKKT